MRDILQNKNNNLVIDSLQYIFENIFDIAAIVLFIKNTITNPSISINNEAALLVLYSQQTIWLLSLIILSGLWKNLLYKKKEDRLNKANDLLQKFDNYSLKDFSYYLHDDNFKQSIISAKDIRISGNCLSSTLYIYTRELLEAIKRGSKVTIIIADYQTKEVPQNLIKNYQGQDFILSTDVAYATSDQRLKFLKSEKNGKLTVGYLPHLMNYGLIIIKGNNYKSEFILVKTYSHRKSSGTPTYLINNENREYFDYFLKEFETLLKCCKDYGRIEKF